jgi:hypothetical protein
VSKNLHRRTNKIVAELLWLQLIGLVDEWLVGKFEGARILPWIALCGCHKLLILISSGIFSSIIYIIISSQKT